MKKNDNKLLDKLSLIISIIFHPLFIPLYTVVLYFYVSPRFFLKENIYPLIYYLVIVSIVIPLLFLTTLKFTGFFSDFLLKTPRERLFFSIVLLSVYFIIIRKISQFHIFIELIPFFIGIFLAILFISIFNFFKHKPSLHAMAFGGITGFFMIWGFYTKTPILQLLMALIMLTSIVLASRIFLKAHEIKEITIGFSAGILAQLLSFILMYYFG